MKQITLDKMFIKPKLLMAAAVALSFSLCSMFAAAAQPDFTAAGSTKQSGRTARDTGKTEQGLSEKKSPAESSTRDFNHMTTGFPLTGAHIIAECGSCHVGGVFKGTPRNCSGCHAKGRRVVATAMSSKHIVTTEPCEVCHSNTVTFLGAKFNHGKAQPGSCISCHNGLIATGKPASHTGIRAKDCEACHKTFAWLPAGFKHTGVVPGTCNTCHGVSATGKPATHVSSISSTSSCDTCHRTSAWLPAYYIHQTASGCSTCHSGTATPEKGKPASHNSGTKATGACELCHRSSAWLPAGFSHTGVAPGSCSTCHGTTATGKPASHTTVAKSTRACDDCHRTTAWLPAYFNHLGVVAGTCATCHTTRPASHTGAKATTACDACHKTTAWLPASFSHAGVAPGTCSTCHEAQRPTSHASRGYTGSCDGCHAISSNWAFNHAAQQGKHTCASCHASKAQKKHGTVTPGSTYWNCDNAGCHTVNSFDR